MMSRLVLCVSLLTVWPSAVRGEWTLQERQDAKPQPYTAHADYVIAVGTEEQLEAVQAADIKDALLAVCRRKISSVVCG